MFEANGDNRIGLLMRAGQTTRWHTMPEVPNQTLADHHWGVALILVLMDPNCSADLLKAALLHDLHESKHGDIPTTAKNDNSRMAEDLARVQWLVDNKLPDYEARLTQNERILLKMADKLEANAYAHNAICPMCRMDVLEGINKLTVEAVAALASGVKND